MDENEMTIAAGYGLAAITVQMALLNSLAGQGGVPSTVIDQLFLARGWPWLILVLNFLTR